MLYIIDGYNFLHAMDVFVFSDTPIVFFVELLESISNNQPKKKFHIVFDGYSPSYYNKKHDKLSKDVKISFSYEESADDVICLFLDMIVEKKNEICLVSDDLALRKYACALNINFISTIDFADFLLKYG